MTTPSRPSTPPQPAPELSPTPAPERRHDDPLDVRGRLDRYLAASGLAAKGATVVPLTGDASDRRYFRVLLHGEPSQVLAVHPGPIDSATLPFVSVARLLARMPVPVPGILDAADALGILALEDLGDVTLQAHLGTTTPERHLALYGEAVDLIAELQRRGADLADPALLPYQLAFDVEKLTWELQFFTTHFLVAYKGASLTDEARALLAAEYLDICSELSSEPRVLCHRDYHSRNLMLHRERLYIIDFQDARLGPDTYDLASLLRDSYVDFTDAQVDQLMRRFVARRDGLAPDVDPGEAAMATFRRRFDLMALQRNLKALGTFGFQATTRNNPVYIQYIPRTLAHVRDNLLRHTRFEQLHRLLAEHVEELRAGTLPVQ